MDTAAWIAAVRARESERADRLFDDPYARELAGEAGFAAMERSESAAGGENAFIPVRVRWFDQVAEKAMASGIRQVVLLGAGYDTRPYRLECPSDVDWFEVDSAQVLARKRAALRQARARCRRHEVAADVSGDWVPELRSSGFSAGRDTLWIAEGLFFYLFEASIVDLMSRSAQLSGPGSLFAADVIGTAGLDSPMMKPYLDHCARNRLPPPFGSSEPDALFARGGWAATAVNSPGAPDANYGRFAGIPGGLRPGSTHLVIGAARTG